MPDEHTLSVPLAADAYERLRILAGVYGSTVETLAGELLANAVVLCTEAEHGPALAGLTMTRADLDELERGRIAMERDAARENLARLRAELRRMAARLVRLAEEEGPPE